MNQFEIEIEDDIFLSLKEINNEEIKKIINIVISFEDIVKISNENKIKISRNVLELIKLYENNEIDEIKQKYEFCEDEINDIAGKIEKYKEVRCSILNYVEYKNSTNFLEGI